VRGRVCASEAGIVWECLRGGGRVCASEAGIVWECLRVGGRVRGWEGERLGEQGRKGRESVVDEAP